jgi:MoaA/NifB/PqqE/SkfB family radical SAM enzyme
MEAEMTDANNRMYAIQGREDGEARRLSHMLEHMASNKAYIHAKEVAGGDTDGVLLEAFRNRYKWYRESWRTLPRRAVEQKLTGERFSNAKIPPLCIDIEVAAVCDLACPFCYRQFIATPDKVISDDLSFRLIDDAAELGVPSMKFNWRGEPLLYPRLAELIAYAKKRGILETIINTNATCLGAETACGLIDAGLDLIIYSFDGGTKESYERMRPGRFKDNRFEEVYENIRRFSEIRSVKGALFPRTKIQMILTSETFSERESFYTLFEEYVDDVSVKQYTERGGKLSELDPTTQQRLQTTLVERNLSPDTPFFRDKDGKLFIAVGRLPCEQPYQRLLVTYDGRAGMCCYDWGAQHPVGYADKLAIELGENEYSRVLERAKAGAKGFIPLKAVGMPRHYNTPASVVQSLSEIWTGSEIDAVRTAHVEGRGGDVAICKTCPFKETYRWEAIHE